MLIKLATYRARVLEGCQSTRKIGRLPFLRKGLFVTNSTLAQALAASITSGIAQFTRSPMIYDGHLAFEGRHKCTHALCEDIIQARRPCS